MGGTDMIASIVNFAVARRWFVLLVTAIATVIGAWALSRLPIDQLKIDRSFVVDVVNDSNAASIASSVIDLAHRMHLKVVAEGVETEAQMAYLGSNHCDEIQGYLFSKPVPADEFASQLREGKSLPAMVR